MRGPRSGPMLITCRVSGPSLPGRPLSPCSIPIISISSLISGKNRKRNSLWGDSKKYGKEEVICV